VALLEKGAEIGREIAVDLCKNGDISLGVPLKLIEDYLFATHY